MRNMNLSVFRASFLSLIRSFVLISVSLFFLNQAGAGLLDDLKEKLEEALEEEVIKASQDGEDKQSPESIQPDPVTFEVQARLNSLGYEVGAVDGVSSGQTIGAILAFQIDRGLPLDGKVTDELLLALRSPPNQADQTPSAANPQSLPNSRPPPVSPNSGTNQTSVAGNNKSVPSATVQSFSQSEIAQQSVGMLAATPIYRQSGSTMNSDWSGLDVPEKLWTVENGIRIPHPITLHGRVLNVNALSHYAKWNGLAGRNGEIWHVLTDYLLLAALRENPEMLEEHLYTFAVRFLPEIERGAYPCSPAEPDSEKPCDARWSGTLVSGDHTLSQLYVSDAHKQHIRQAILSKRNHLVDAAPKLPIKLVDVGNFGFNPYDHAKGGLVLNFGLTGDHKFHGDSSRGVHYLYNKNTGGATSEEDWQAPLIGHEQVAGERMVFEAIAGGVIVSNVGPSFRPINVGAYLSGFLKVDQEEGQALTDRFSGAAWMQYRVNLVEMKVDTGTYRWEWKAHMGPVAVYADRHFKQEPYQIGCENIPGCMAGYQE